jgi:Sulfotransferase family
VPWRPPDQTGRQYDAAHIPVCVHEFLGESNRLIAAGGCVGQIPRCVRRRPQARIIHMQRHPIDTCLSIYFQNFFSIGPYANDLGNLAHYYREYLRITDHWRAVLPATTLLEVPYEALIEDQERWTRRLLEFIGLPWDARCLDFHQTERVVITASKWQVRQKISKSSVARWRHYEQFVGPLRGLLDSSRYS